MLTGFPAPGLRAALDTVAAADGLIAVTPTFSASYNGLFKMLFDVLEPDVLTGRPTLLGATGGTARHSLALEHAVRPLLTHLRAVSVPTAVFAAPEDLQALCSCRAGGDHSGPSLADRIDRAAGELADLVAARAAARPADPFAAAPSFEDLLRGA
nr:CE1759 family FMN reductase [Pseudonocardia nigra]